MFRYNQIFLYYHIQFIKSEYLIAFKNLAKGSIFMKKLKFQFNETNKYVFNISRIT